MADDVEIDGYYLAVDPYTKDVVVVRVIQKSDAVEEHWKCAKQDGRKILLPRPALIRRVFGFA